LCNTAQYAVKIVWVFVRVNKLAGDTGFECLGRIDVSRKQRFAFVLAQVSVWE
jgi:hypothetical protein